uniref:Uncharacterized protein n=1 Tax=Cucumis melo TaxID=3656 RepID=A0A9I9E3T7_CUCME
MHFQQRKWAKWMNSWCSSQKKSNDNARDSVSFLEVKTSPSTTSLFCVRLKHSELWDLNSNYISLNFRYGTLEICTN